jgi:UDP-glucose 4-epimerase
MKKVLITGGTGFIGNRLLKYLDNKKVPIILLSRESKTIFETFTCDFMSDSIPEDAFNGVDTVFHLAGLSHDTRNEFVIKDQYTKINIEATIHIAKLAIKKGVKSFVFVSSVKAGGVSKNGVKRTEDKQGEPDGVYGRTKREAELKLLELSSKSDIHLSILRPCLVYGPNVKGNLRMMMNAINNGWFPPLPKINNKRTMVHVDDLVRAILLVSQDARANGQIFNVTDGKVYSSREIYETMCFIMKKTVPSWSLPNFIFTFISFLIPSIKYKTGKLLGNECYSSKKIETIGFIPQLSLKDMNETFF